MRRIQSADAKARLPQLLDDVERGESVVITRHGRPIARIIPEKSQRKQEIDEARAAIEALRKLNGPITVEEILSPFARVAATDALRAGCVGHPELGVRGRS